jgi:hypothetical protein
MTIGAGCSVRRGGAYKRGIIQCVPLRRRACPGRSGPALAIERSPAGGENLLADFEYVVEFDLAEFNITLIHVFLNRRSFAYS